MSNLNSDDIIFNYSHRVLTEAEKMVLARGLRFCLPPKKVVTSLLTAGSVSELSADIPFCEYGQTY